MLRLQTRVLLSGLLCGALAIGAVQWLTSLGVSARASSLGGLAVALVVALIAMRLATRPARLALRALHDGVMGFAESDFATRLTLPSPDEVGDLVTVFNRMGAVLREERAELIQR